MSKEKDPELKTKQGVLTNSVSLNLEVKVARPGVESHNAELCDQPITQPPVLGSSLPSADISKVQALGTAHLGT